MQNLKRNFILIGLIVLAVFIPFQDTMAADCKDILVYIFPDDTTHWPLFDGDLKTCLAEDGFNVTVRDREFHGNLTPALISNYGQIWIIDAGDEATTNITDTEINDLIAHYNAGNSILLTAEDVPIATDPTSYNDANKIAQRFNTTMKAGVHDGTEFGSSTVNQTGSIHSAPILNGVSIIRTSGDTSNTTITTINPSVESVATSFSGFDIIYALDETTKRVLFHLSYYTFHNGDDYIGTGESRQYTKNVANWLCVSSDPPTCALSASPSSINSGDSVTLTWTSDNATAVDSSNFGAAGISGSATVSPTSSTTYNLTVSGSGGTGSCATSVSVSSPSTPLPPITGGLIPCGRKTDNPDTDNVDERDECTVCHFFLMIKNIMDFITKIAVIVAIFFISFGGLMYVLSTGNEAMLSKAKAMITYAIVGFILIFAAWIIIELILSTFGYTNPLGGEWDVIC